MRWDRFDRYYFSLYNSGGVTSFSVVVSGWERNSIMVGGDGNVRKDAAAAVIVSLVGVVPLSITITIIMKWSALRQTQDYKCDDLEIKSAKEK